MKLHRDHLHRKNACLSTKICIALARDSMQILMQTVMQMGNAEICIVPAEQSTLA